MHLLAVIDVADNGTRAINIYGRRSCDGTASGTISVVLHDFRFAMFHDGLASPVIAAKSHQLANNSGHLEVSGTKTVVSTMPAVLKSRDTLTLCKTF